MSDHSTAGDSAANRGEQASVPARRRLPLLALLPLIVFSALVVLFLAQLLSGRDVSEVPSALIGRPAPEFTLAPVPELTSGGDVVPGFSRADLLGKVSIVNIFASWCVPCRDEHPFLMELARDRRIQMLGINYKDKPANARDFLEGFGNPYLRVGADDTGRAAIEWGVYGVPETFIVDAEGTIRYKFIGPMSERSYHSVILPQLESILSGSQS